VALDGLMASAGFSVAEGPRRVRVAETEYVHGIYRRVDEGTPG
jgi:hypothetical protein